MKRERREPGVAEVGVVEPRAHPGGPVALRLAEDGAAEVGARRSSPG